MAAMSTSNQSKGARMSFPLLERSGPVAVLTLNRPDKLNSLSLEAIKELQATLHLLRAEPSVRAVLITGAGRGFCAGWELDVQGVPGLPDESLGVRQSHLMEEYFNPLIRAIDDLPIPSVCAVNGVSAGAGVSLALACDIVMAADSASFVLTFAPRLGLVPDLGVSWKLPRLIGWARAQAVTMLGERIDAGTAERWGLIWRQVPAASLKNEALAVAKRLAGAPPGVCLEVRKTFATAQLNDLVSQMDHERLRQRELLDAPAFSEGLRAFQDKREPNFHSVPMD
jgi:2-(1,2-epoxy-1,2-dihydrophenyl)acetyl-CoA isomerase